MKILVVCQYYYPEPFRITNICESLVEMGHDITVLTGLPNYPEGRVHNEYRFGKRRKEVLNGVKVIRSFEIGRGANKMRLFINYLSFALSASIKTLFMREKFDVILVNQLSPVMMAIPAIIYKKIKRKKVLLYCLDLWPDSLAAGGIKEDSVIYKFITKISKWIYSSVDTIAVTSFSFKKYFKDVLMINLDEIHYLPQYAEGLFTKNVKVHSNKNFNFVFAGNIGEMQSVETIIKAANELREHDEIVFHIIGDGSKLEECMSLTSKLELNNIIFYGRKPVNEMPKYYSLADAMLVTLKNNNTISNTLPGKIQSYMAAGKPIIGAINGETRDVIETANCGLCCRAEDYKELANIIIGFCQSNQKDRMAKNSYDYYIKNFSKEKFMAGLEKILKNLED